MTLIADMYNTKITLKNYTQRATESRQGSESYFQRLWVFPPPPFPPRRFAFDPRRGATLVYNDSQMPRNKGGHRRIYHGTKAKITQSSVSLIYTYNHGATPWPNVYAQTHLPESALAAATLTIEHFPIPICGYTSIYKKKQS